MLEAGVGDEPARLQVEVGKVLQFANVLEPSYSDESVSLYAAANPEPLTVAVNVNGRVRVATSACAHKSLTFNATTELEMLSA